MADHGQDSIKFGMFVFIPAMWPVLECDVISRGGNVRRH